MIVVDTSALLAVLLLEADAKRIKEILESEDRVIISAGTLSEALIVALQKNLRMDLELLLERIKVHVYTLNKAHCKFVADAYSKWGKGINPARLNFGDCFAYALAKEHDVPLLYVGNDFARTDIVSAMER